MTSEESAPTSDSAHDQVPDWVGIDHVQLAIPVGGEDVARSFFVDVFGLTEAPKPPVMAARGGAWFEAGPVRVHVGVDPTSFPLARHTPH